MKLSRRVKLALGHGQRRVRVGVATGNAYPQKCHAHKQKNSIKWQCGNGLSLNLVNDPGNAG